MSLDERGGGTVSAFDAAVHEAKEVAAGMLAGKLQAAVKSRFRGHLEQRGVLSRLWRWHSCRACRDRRPRTKEVTALGSRLSAIFGDIFGKVGAEGVERGLRVVQAGFDAQIVGDDAGVARLGAARLPQILEAEIGIEDAVRWRGQGPSRGSATRAMWCPAGSWHSAPCRVRECISASPRRAPGAPNP